MDNQGCGPPCSGEPVEQRFSCIFFMDVLQVTGHSKHLYNKQGMQVCCTDLIKESVSAVHVIGLCSLSALTVRN